MSTRLVRVLYKCLLRRGKLFDKYPLLKTWCDFPSSRKWYSPVVSFAGEVRKAFRIPITSKHQQIFLINEAFYIYRNWGEIYAKASANISWFHKYIKSNKGQIPIQKTKTGPVVIPMDKIVPGQILASHPRDEDPQWTQLVILILKSNHRGIVGVTINKISKIDNSEDYYEDDDENTINDEVDYENTIENDGEEESYVQKFEDAFIQNEAINEEEETTEDDHLEVIQEHRSHYYGGPVPGCVVLHTKKDHKGSTYCADGVYSYICKDGESQSIPDDIFVKLDNSRPSRDYRIFDGYVEWSEGQLEAEIERGWWFVVKCPLPVLFPPKQHEEIQGDNFVIPDKVDFSNSLMTQEMWSKVLRLLGGEYYHFAHLQIQKKGVNDDTDF